MSRLGTLLLSMALAILVSALAPAVTHAQRPVYKGAAEDRSSFGNAKVVDDPQTLFAYYADLAPGRPDIYQVYAIQGQPFNTTLRIPMSDDLKTFTPSMALIGPGIGKPVTSANSGVNDLPVKPPTATGTLTNGVLIVDYKGDAANRGTYSEPFSFASYWNGQEVRQTFPYDGPYYVVVWDKQKRGGKYVLTIGDKDDFGLLDLVKYPYTWVKLQLWFGNWLALGVAVVILAALVFLIIRLVSMRRKSSPPNATQT
jgi:hypothetical protein